MKIAFTADLHLKSKVESSERYNALSSIIEKIRQIKITHLVICGDLFDKDFPNYSDFDNFCKINNDLDFLIITGNHDPNFNEKYFTSSNIKVINQSKIIDFDGLNFLFIPYSFDKSIDEEVSRFLTNYEKVDEKVDEKKGEKEYGKENEKSFENIILVGHGDYLASSFNINLNGYEDGLYMPLTSNTINKYNFKKVILGHIHKPSNFGKVYYPGSPVPLDITETGKRSFLVYDTLNDTIDRIFVETDFIYFNMEILSFPDENEFDLIKKQIDKFILDYDLNEIETNKILLLLKIKGFTKDRKNLIRKIEEYLKMAGLRVYEKDGLNKDRLNKNKDRLNKDNLDINSLNKSNINKNSINEDEITKKAIDIEQLKDINEIDSVKKALFENFKQKVETLDLKNLLINGHSISCLKEEILIDGMNIIFG